MAYSEFENDYKVAINNILKDLYKDTEYWGVGPAGNQGIIKPITDSDDPKWSNYNFINTHWTVRDKVVNPFLGDLPIEKDKNILKVRPIQTILEVCGRIEKKFLV